MELSLEWNTMVAWLTFWWRLENFF